MCGTCDTVMWTLMGPPVTHEMTPCMHILRQTTMHTICSLTLILSLSVKIIASIIILTDGSDNFFYSNLPQTKQTHMHKKKNRKGERERERDICR